MKLSMKLSALSVFAAATLLACASQGSAAPGASPAAAGQAGSAVEGAKGTLIEGFESKAPSWSAVGSAWGDGDRSLDIKFSQDKAGITQGKQSAALGFDLIPGKGASFFTESMNKSDWTGYGYLIADFVNPNEQMVKVSFFVKTGGSWVWHETALAELHPGVNKDVRFGLQDGTIKSEASKWQATGNVANPQTVNSMGVKLFCDEGLKGLVFLDNIRIAK